MRIVARRAIGMSAVSMTILRRRLGLLVHVLFTGGVEVVVGLTKLLNRPLLRAAATEAVVVGKNDEGFGVLRQLGLLLDVAPDGLLDLVIVRVVLALVVTITVRIEMVIR